MGEFIFHGYGKINMAVSAARRQGISPQIKSAMRVFEILEQFDRTRIPLRLTEIAQALNLPTSSTAALLKCMNAQGYLNFDSKERRYFPTARVSRLASWIQAQDFEQGVVFNALRNLQRLTNELVLLATPNGIYLEYVETLRSTEGIQLYVAPGTKRILVQTGTGWLFLSRRPRDEARAVYDSTVRAGEIDATKFSKWSYRDRLKDNRRRTISFVRARDLVLPVAHWGGGMVSILCPVPPGHRPLALCVGGPAERLEAKLPEISRYLKAQTANIARSIKSLPAK